ncbi:MAG: tellurium resistance protein TerC [Caldilineaceae bacterium]|nr:tellurium resistance protein TerC [Caldilineaceae bacterium]
MELTWLFIIIQLILLEGLLSIDNAAVLGAMVAPLSMDEPIPWPSWLRGLGHMLDPLLGGQQMAALKVGLLGAYLGRGTMLMVAHQIVRYPWLQLVGGAYLIYLGIEHLAMPGELDAGDDHADSRTQLQGFWHVVLMVELADLVFSLDNVVAAVALSDQIWVVLVGVGLGILALRWAAGFFSIMVDREPVLLHAAYVLVLVIGLRFCLEQWLDLEIPAAVQFVVSLSILGLALLYAHWSPMRWLHPLVHWVRRMLHRGMTLVKQVVTLRSWSGVEAEGGRERG